MKICLAYASRTGNSELIANQLISKLEMSGNSIDVIKIEPETMPRFFGAGAKSMKQEEMKLKNTEVDIGQYDLFIIGGPVWAGRPSPLFASFLELVKNAEGKKAAYFVTQITPIGKNKEMPGVMKNNLNKKGFDIVGEPLILRMKKGEFLDGEENIDDFVKAIGE